MRIERGKRDHRIEIQKATEAGRDRLNNVIWAWPKLMSVLAEKEDIRDGERFAAAEVGADVTTRFRTEWYARLADLNPKDRCVHRGRVYDIVAVKEIGRREGIEITATARADK